MWFLTLLRPLLPYAITALVGVVGYIGVGAHYYVKGYNAAINEIAAENKEAIDAAAKARELHHSCVDHGGVWDTSTGRCG